jgi:hypothetical protein
LFSCFRQISSERVARLLISDWTFTSLLSVLWHRLPRLPPSLPRRRPFARRCPLRLVGWPSTAWIDSNTGTLEHDTRRTRRNGTDSTETGSGQLQAVAGSCRQLDVLLKTVLVCVCVYLVLAYFPRRPRVCSQPRPRQRPLWLPSLAIRPNRAPISPSLFTSSPRPLFGVSRPVVILVNDEDPTILDGRHSPPIQLCSRHGRRGRVSCLPRAPLVLVPLTW